MNARNDHAIGKVASSVHSHVFHPSMDVWWTVTNIEQEAQVCKVKFQANTKLCLLGNGITTLIIYDVNYRWRGSYIFTKT